MKTLHFLLAPLLLLFAIPLLHAQSGGSRDGDLYIPPKLTIGLKSDMSWLSRFYGSDYPVEESNFSQELRIERSRSMYNSLRPLPIIFFDPASSVIPARYQLFGRSLDADDYREDQEIDVTYQTDRGSNPKYLEILNIIGYRMSQEDTITLELLGGYSTEPGENEEIGRERSEVVAEYLQNIWRIDPARITILPPQRLADSTDHILAQEEARSVRIYPSTWHLLEPVQYTRSELTMQMITLSVGLAPNMPRSEIASIRLVIASGDDILGETVMSVPEGEEYSPIGWAALWFLPRKITAIEEPLSFNAVVETRSGSLRASNTVTVPVVIEEPEEREREEEYVTDIASSSGESEVRFDDWEEGEGYEPEYSDGYSDESDGYEEYEYTEYDVTEFAGEMHYFDFRDTTLGRLQQMAFEQDIAAIREAMAADTNYRWRIGIDPGADASENPEADDAVLRTGKSLSGTSQSFFNDFFTDPDFRLSLYIFPESVPEGDFGQEMMIADMISQMYGDRAPEVQRMQDQAAELYTESYSSPRGVPAFDSLRAARARGLMRHALTVIDSTHIDSVVINLETYYGGGIDWLPEERYYSRSIRWQVHRADSWRWREDEESDEYEGYYYDAPGDDGEFIETEEMEIPAEEEPEMEYEENEEE